MARAPELRLMVMTALLASLGACSFLSTEAELRCELGGEGNPCPRPLACVDGRCVPQADCVPMPEICNGLDDDCDGVIDEDTADIPELCNGLDDNCNGFVDEGFDDDGDNFNRCGTQDCFSPRVPPAPAPLGAPRLPQGCEGNAPRDECRCEPNPARRDCNDDDRSINPDAEEQCNIVDHDCDGRSVPDDLSELDARCDAAFPDFTMICSPERNGCIDADCLSGRPEFACSGDEVCDARVRPAQCIDAGCTSAECATIGRWCDPETGMCQPRRRNGEACDGGQTQCIGACWSGGDLGLGASLRVCATACCADTDCDADEICWDPGTGVRACLPVGPLTPGREGPGTEGPLAECTSNAQCRSGLCQGGRCFTPCRVDGDCGGADRTCSVVERSDPGGPRFVMACAEGRLAANSGCTSTLDCGGRCCSRKEVFGAITIDCERVQTLSLLEMLADGTVDRVCHDERWCMSTSDCSTCRYVNLSSELWRPPHPVMTSFCSDRADTTWPACCVQAHCGDDEICGPVGGTSMGCIRR